MNHDRFGDFPEDHSEGPDSGNNETVMKLLAEEVLEQLRRKRKKKFSYTTRSLMAMAFDPSWFAKKKSKKEFKEKDNQSPWLWNVRRFRKKSGGYRKITEPAPILKQVHGVVHSMLKRTVQKRFDSADWLYGVRSKARSTSFADNAHHHQSGKYIFTSDLQDCFESITFEHVFRALRALERIEVKPGYHLILDNNAVSFLASLLTHQRRLPQGAKTSPLVANLVLLEFDDFVLRELNKRSQAFTYSRYFDDITISLSDTENISDQQFQAVCTSVIQRAASAVSMRVNEKKTRCRFHFGAPIEVTGIVLQQQGAVLPRKLARFLKREIRRFEVHEEFVPKRTLISQTRQLNQEQKQKREDDAKDTGSSNLNGQPTMRGLFDKVQGLAVSVDSGDRFYGSLSSERYKYHLSHDPNENGMRILRALRSLLDPRCSESYKKWSAKAFSRVDGGFVRDFLHTVQMPSWFDANGDISRSLELSASEYARWKKEEESTCWALIKKLSLNPAESIIEIDPSKNFEVPDVDVSQASVDAYESKLALLLQCGPVGEGTLDYRSHQRLSKNWLRVRGVVENSSADICGEDAWRIVRDVFRSGEGTQWTLSVDSKCAITQNLEAAAHVYDRTGLVPFLLIQPFEYRRAFVVSFQEWSGRVAFLNHIRQKLDFSAEDNALIDSYEKMGLESIQTEIDVADRRVSQLRGSNASRSLSFIKHYVRVADNQRNTTAADTLISKKLGVALQGGPEDQLDFLKEFLPEGTRRIPLLKDQSKKNDLVLYWKEKQRELGLRSLKLAKDIPSFRLGDLIDLVREGRHTDSSEWIDTDFEGQCRKQTDQFVSWAEGVAPAPGSELVSSLDVFLEFPTRTNLAKVARSTCVVFENFKVDEKLRESITNKIFHPNSLFTKLRNIASHGLDFTFQQRLYSAKEKLQVKMRNGFQIDSDIDVDVEARKDAKSECIMIQRSLDKILHTKIEWPSEKEPVDTEEVLPSFTEQESYEVMAHFLRLILTEIQKFNDDEKKSADGFRPRF